MVSNPENLVLGRFGAWPDISTRRPEPGLEQELEQEPSENTRSPSLVGAVVLHGVGVYRCAVGAIRSPIREIV